MERIIIGRVNLMLSSISIVQLLTISSLYPFFFLSIIHCSSFIIYYLLFIIYYILFIIVLTYTSPPSNQTHKASYLPPSNRPGLIRSLLRGGIPVFFRSVIIKHEQEDIIIRRNDETKDQACMRIGTNAAGSIVRDVLREALKDDERLGIPFVL